VARPTVVVATAVLTALIFTGARPGAANDTAAAVARASCSGDSCQGLNPQSSGCSANAQTMASKELQRRNGWAYAELRYSAACNAGWLRIRSLSFITRPSAWHPGAQSVGRASGPSSVWRWTLMVSAADGRRICGGAQLYNLLDRWLQWWFVACFQPPSRPTPAPPAPGPAPPAPAPTPPAPAPTWWEQESVNHPVNTFTNHHNASGLGPAIATGQWVQVSCKVYDPYIASVNPDGYWYRIASLPWNNNYYAPANTFMNGDPPGGPYLHNTDFAVRDC
jgi:Protein of unknown function (DUF2690)